MPIDDADHLEIEGTIRDLKTPIDDEERKRLEMEWATEELKVSIGVMLPLLLARNVIRLDSHIEGVGSITAYWVNEVLRIDIKPVQK